MLHKLARNTSIAYVLIFSFVFALFAPVSANAGVINSILNFIHPYSSILGQIGGAIAGASIGAGFCPPLGMIAGGIVGYVVGGHLASYATGGLSNVATLAGAAAGYCACISMGPVGAVAGVFLGGLLGKIAYKLVKKLDNSITGGVLLAPEKPAEAVSVGDTTVTLNDNIPAVGNNVIAPNPNAKVTDADLTVQEATAKYEAAYQNYISVARDGASSEEINKAHKEYVDAYNTYKKVTGK